MASQFSSKWNASTSTRKQRKFQYNAPLHVQGRFLNVHLTSELRAKHGVRSVRVRSGDKVKVLRGGFKGHEGKVTRIDVKAGKVYVEGVELVKGEGMKVQLALTPSNLMLTSIELKDQKRKKKLSGSGDASAPSQSAKKETKEKKEEKPQAGEKQ